MPPWSVGVRHIGIGLGATPVQVFRKRTGNGSIALPTGTQIGDLLTITTCGRDAPNWGPNALAQTSYLEELDLSPGFDIRIGQVQNLNPIDVTANNSNGAADAFVAVNTAPGVLVNTSRRTAFDVYHDSHSAGSYLMDAPWGPACPGFINLKASWGGIGGSYGSGGTNWNTSPLTPWNSTGEDGSYMCLSLHWSPKPWPPAQALVTARNGSFRHRIFALQKA